MRKLHITNMFPLQISTLGCHISDHEELNSRTPVFIFKLLSSIPQSPISTISEHSVRPTACVAMLKAKCRSIQEPDAKRGASFLRSSGCLHVSGANGDYRVLMSLDSRMDCAKPCLATWSMARPSCSVVVTY